MTVETSLLSRDQNSGTDQICLPPPLCPLFGHLRCLHNFTLKKWQLQVTQSDFVPGNLAEPGFLLLMPVVLSARVLGAKVGGWQRVMCMWNEPSPGTQLFVCVCVCVCVSHTHMQTDILFYSFFATSFLLFSYSPLYFFPASFSSLSNGFLFLLQYIIYRKIAI